MHVKLGSCDMFYAVVLQTAGMHYRCERKSLWHLIEPSVAEGEGGLALEAQVLLQRQHRRAVQPPIL